jgi:hypothetical protein
MTGHAPETAATLPWRTELAVLARDWWTCRVCGGPAVADDDRLVVRADPAKGDEIENLVALCARCGRAHRNHPLSIPPLIEPMGRMD